MSPMTFVHYPATRQPGMEALRAALAEHRAGYALPRSFYKDPAIFPLDMRHFVMAHWHCVGHVSMVAEANAFFTAEVDEAHDVRVGTLVEFNRTEKIFGNPDDSRTDDYVTGRFG